MKQEKIKHYTFIKQKEHEGDSCPHFFLMLCHIIFDNRYSNWVFSIISYPNRQYK